MSRYDPPYNCIANNPQDPAHLPEHERFARNSASYLQEQKYAAFDQRQHQLARQRDENWRREHSRLEGLSDKYKQEMQRQARLQQGLGAVRNASGQAFDIVSL